MATLHDRLVAALLKHGAAKVADHRSTKYTVLTKNGVNYYVGHKGALRSGHTIAGSLPLDRTKARLLEGQPNGS